MLRLVIVLLLLVFACPKSPKSSVRRERRLFLDVLLCSDQCGSDKVIACPGFLGRFFLGSKSLCVSRFFLFFVRLFVGCGCCADEAEPVPDFCSAGPATAAPSADDSGAIDIAAFRDQTYVFRGTRETSVPGAAPTISDDSGNLYTVTYDFATSESYDLIALGPAQGTLIDSVTCSDALVVVQLVESKRLISVEESFQVGSLLVVDGEIFGSCYLFGVPIRSPYDSFVQDGYLEITSATELLDGAIEVEGIPRGFDAMFQEQKLEMDLVEDEGSRQAESACKHSAEIDVATSFGAFAKGSVTYCSDFAFRQLTKSYTDDNYGFGMELDVEVTLAVSIEFGHRFDYNSAVVKSEDLFVVPLPGLSSGVLGRFFPKLKLGFFLVIPVVFETKPTSTISMKSTYGAELLKNTYSISWDNVAGFEYSRSGPSLATSGECSPNPTEVGLGFKVETFAGLQPGIQGVFFGSENTIGISFKAGVFLDGEIKAPPFHARPPDDESKYPVEVPKEACESAHRAELKASVGAKPLELEWKFLLDPPFTDEKLNLAGKVALLELNATDVLLVCLDPCKLCADNVCIDEDDCCPEERYCDFEQRCILDASFSCCPDSETQCLDGTCTFLYDCCGARHCYNTNDCVPAGQCCPDEKRCTVNGKCVGTDVCCPDSNSCGGGGGGGGVGAAPDTCSEPSRCPTESCFATRCCPGERYCKKENVCIGEDKCCDSEKECEYGCYPETTYCCPEEACPSPNSAPFNDGTGNCCGPGHCCNREQCIGCCNIGCDEL